MKKNHILAMLMALAISVSLFIIPSTAADVDEPQADIEIHFEDENISEELKAKATAYFLNGTEDDTSATYGLTCTLLGHKLETTTVTKTTHKARTTAPRCLKKTYNYSACTRCDYEESTLKSSTYIACCA